MTIPSGWKSEFELGDYISFAFVNPGAFGDFPENYDVPDPAWSEPFVATAIGQTGPAGSPGTAGVGYSNAEVVAGELTFTGVGQPDAGPFDVRGPKGTDGEQYEFQNTGNVTFTVTPVSGGNDTVSATANVTGGFDILATDADGGDITIDADNNTQEVNRLATTDYVQGISIGHGQLPTETTITDDDTKIPTSGAVVDYTYTKSDVYTKTEANAEFLENNQLETTVSTSDVKVPSSGSSSRLHLHEE